MFFTVYTDDQINQMQEAMNKPFLTGIGEFVIQSAREGLSKSGNEYMEIIMKAFDANGTERIVYDYLIDTEKWAFKIRHFFSSIGMIGDYENRKTIFAEDLVGKTGRADYIFRKEKDQDGLLVERLRVKDYVKQETAGESFFDDIVDFGTGEGSKA